MKNFFRKLNFGQKGSAALLLIMALVLAGAGIVGYRQVNKTSQVKMTAGVPTLTFSVEPQINSKEQDFDLIINVNPNGAEFHAFELYFNFDRSQVEIQDQENPAQNITSSYSLIKSEIDTASGKVSLVGTRLGSAISGNQNTELARIRMNSIRSSLASGAFSWDQSSKIGKDIQKQLVNY